MLPEVEHWSNSYEIVEHLRELQSRVAPAEFEVGMSTRSRSWMFRRRIEVGAQFLTTGPVIDPATVAGVAQRLAFRPHDPPVYLEITPPFSPAWVKRLQSVGAITCTDAFLADLEATPERDLRRTAWALAKGVAANARTAGFAGIVIMGLKFATVVGEAYEAWRDASIEPTGVAKAVGGSTL